ncbi:MAG: hypothetical protein IV100_15920 [Myxococcales bacterium]|nr:hypothetical protein [Myxococcales bacterium]
MRSTVFEARAREPGAATDARTLDEQLTSLIERRLQLDPGVTALRGPELSERLEKFMTRIRAGLERKQRAEALVRDLQTDAALPELIDTERELLAAWKDVHDRITRTPQLADLSLVLALAHADRREDAAVHEALKSLFLRDPLRRFEPGFYDAEFESRLATAWTNVRVSQPKEQPLGSPERLERFMSEVDADTFVHAWIEDGDSVGSRRVRIIIYDRLLPSVAFTTPVGPDGGGTIEAVDRFLSRYLTCLAPVTIEKVGVTPPPDPEPWLFIDAGFAYSIFAQETTREPFHNLGLAISAEFQFLSGLGAFVEVDMFTSTLDPQRDLVSSFTSIRTLTGLSYAFRGAWWRFNVHFGFDVQFLGSYRTTTDPWCKLGGFSDSRCAEAETTDLASDVTGGFHGAFGVQFFVNPNVYLGLRTGMSAYIVPLDEAIEVNFPFTVQASLGYAL